ncbi:MAG: hypothetical protein AAGJ35_02415, partial [Myxococcota bacterium]
MNVLEKLLLEKNTRVVRFQEPPWNQTDKHVSSIGKRIVERLQQQQQSLSTAQKEPQHSITILLEDWNGAPPGALDAVLLHLTEFVKLHHPNLRLCL